MMMAATTASANNTNDADADKGNRDTNMDSYQVDDGNNNKSNSLDALRDSVASDMIGDKTLFTSPFQLVAEQGNTNNANTTNNTSNTTYQVPLVYCDHTASSRCLTSIEQYIHSNVLPCLANTHTTTSYTGTQSTSFVSEARQVIGEVLGAKVTGKASTDTVLFCGNGAGVTSAVNLLIDILGIRQIIQGQAQQGGAPDLRPVLFTSAMEHHSNLIPWREAGCRVVTIPLNVETGDLDLEYLAKALTNPEYGYNDNSSNNTDSSNINTIIRMASFSACSNITGRMVDTLKVTALLHSHGVLSFWDYATAASYCTVEMNPSPPSLPVSVSSTTGTPSYYSAALLAKDAIFLSPHKLLGGPGSVGVLVIKKNLVSQVAPPMMKSGGGTVFYVTQHNHRFLSNRLERYEGGSPNVPAIVRTGLTFLHKRRLDSNHMYNINSSSSISSSSNIISSSTPSISKARLYQQHYDRVVSTLKQNAPNLVLLGAAAPTAGHANESSSPPSSAVSIFSILIQCGNRFLHFNYVCAILNDVFGVQCRGGCQCAGPYVQQLLGLTNEQGVPNATNTRLEDALYNNKQHELLRPGVTRVSLPLLCMRQSDIDYVIKALEWTAQHAWKLLPLYRCNHKTGEWRHYSRQGKPLGGGSGTSGAGGRKWINHYITPFQQEQKQAVATRDGTAPAPSTSFATTAITKTNQKMTNEEWTARLERTLRNANVILEQSLANKGNYKLSGAGGGAGGSSNDILPDEISDLRWYVYPQECAQWLHLLEQNMPNKIDPSHTMPNSGGADIVGAVRPVDLCGYRSVDVAEEEEVQEGKANVNVDTAVNNKNDAYADADVQMMENAATAVASATTKLIKAEQQEDDDDDGDRWEAELMAVSVPLPMPVPMPMEEEQVLVQHTLKAAASANAPTPSLAPEVPVVVDVQSEEQAQAAPRLRSICSINGTCSISPTTGTDKDNTTPVVVESTTNAVAAAAATKPTAAAKETTNETQQPKAATTTSTTGTGPKKKEARDSSMWGGGAGSSEVQAAASLATKHLQSIAAAAAANASATASSTTAHANVNSVPSPSILTKAAAPQNDTSQSQPPVPVIQSNKMKKSKHQRHIKPPAKLQRMVTKALVQWNMIEEGDKLLLGLSGGKDSMTLLHCLMEFQRILKTNFTIEVCTIDPMTESFDPSPLIPYVRDVLGLTYHFLQHDIVDRANTSGDNGKIVSSLCSYCARMKRGMLYQCARTNGCNKLVLAQHLDDCAESFMMSFVHNGFLRTMKANYRIDAEDLTVIRPLVYVRENQMTQFAQAAGLPIINENCPACFEEPKERARIKKLLLREETQFPSLYDNLRKALVPLMHEDTQFMMRYYTEQVVSKSRKPQGDGSYKNKKGSNNKNQNKGKGKQHNGKKGDDDAEDEDTGGSAKMEVDADSAAAMANTNNDCETKAPFAAATATSIIATSSTSAKSSLQDASVEELMAELSRRHLGNVKVPTMVTGYHGSGSGDRAGGIAAAAGGVGSATSGGGKKRQRVQSPQRPSKSESAQGTNTNAVEAGETDVDVNSVAAAVTNKHRDDDDAGDGDSGANNNADACSMLASNGMSIPCYELME
jgi:selenocysteine lyase/cysteine desulfurase/tRNA(Ile)-lysidine synthase TilS/MesJ